MSEVERLLAEQAHYYWQRAGEYEDWWFRRGRVFFVDSLRSDLASATDHKLPDPEDHTMLRRLADGREYRIVKRFTNPSNCTSDSPASAGRSMSTRHPHSSSTGKDSPLDVTHEQILSNPLHDVMQ